MPRPVKWRRVCELPVANRFGPLGLGRGSKGHVNMTVDEYEAIRLIDFEGLNQEECASQMGIARTTVQGIYVNARKKLARSLVEGMVLHIEGGEYKLCDGQEDFGGCGRRVHRCARRQNRQGGPPWQNGGGR